MWVVVCGGSWWGAGGVAREVDPARQNRPSCAETRAVDPVRQACGAPRCRTGNSWVTVIVVNVTFYSLVIGVGGGMGLHEILAPYRYRR